MEGNEGLVVHELNSTVEFKGLSQASGVEIAEKILKYAIRIVKK